jgi:hypothetical protein
MATLEAIKPVIQERTAEDELVRAIDIDVREDGFGEDALYVTLTLADPSTDDDRWNVDHLQQLRETVDEALAAQDLQMTWYVVFTPEHADIDDEGDQLQL